METLFIHRKTKKKYIRIAICINCTNTENGQIMVIYARKGEIFCRERKEFNAKFFGGHNLFEDGDKNIPKCITDSNGQVVLAMCKVCGKAESELTDSTCT